MTTETELEYVGFWARVLASVIDTVLVLVVIMPILYAIYGSAYFDSTSLSQGPAHIFFSYVMPAVAVLVFWIARQATPGKMAISARIVDARTGNKPTTGQYLVRYLGYYISMIPFGLGLLWVGIDSRKQGWHDKLAGTVVVRPKRDGAVKFDR
ncbi:MAG: RDD family protein [Herminiimonas sp.]|nr:RDD family protein [Herminiimonas sp.]